MSLGGLQYTPSVSILAYRICKILIANLIKYIEKKNIYIYVLVSKVTLQKYRIEFCTGVKFSHLFHAY